MYQAALRYFTPDELAEAFAATRGVASPTQLRQHLKQDGRDLLAEFRAMAPARRPIAVQRWSFRRVVLILTTILLLFLAVLTGIGLFFPTRGTVTAPDCGTGTQMQLMAQAVPTATKLPCVADLPLGWSVGEAETIRGHSMFVVGVGDGSTSAVTVTLTETCPPMVEGTQQMPVDGGCVVYAPVGPGPGCAVVLRGRRADVHGAGRRGGKGGVRGRSGALRRARAALSVARCVYLRGTGDR